MKNPENLNIILITLDTARARSFSVYGNSRKTTPFLDDFSKECVVYRRCYAPSPWTSPSHASLFTGLYPSQHGVFDYFNLQLSRNFYTIPEILSAAGYRTLGISCNALINRTSGFGRGFEWFSNVALPYDDAEVERIRATLDVPWHRQIKVFFKDSLWAGKTIPLIKAKINSYYMNRVMEKSFFATRKAMTNGINVIRNSHYPFFLFINLMETHTVYNPPVDYRNKFVRDNSAMEKKLFLAQRYDMAYYSQRIDITAEEFEYLKSLYEEALLFLDNFIENIVTELQKKKILDSTMLIITGDHGEHVGEKGHFTHVFSLYNEVLHVPLIIKYPYGFPAPSVNDSVVQLNDIFATTLDVTGLEYPSPDTSISLVGKDRRESAFAQYYLSREYFFKSLKYQNPDYDVAFFPYDYSMLALIQDRHKIIKKYKTDRSYEYEFYEITENAHEESCNKAEDSTYLLKKIEEFEISTRWREIVEQS
ncbi:MAG: sulfatase [Nitrospirota bacterium]